MKFFIILLCNYIYIYIYIVGRNNLNKVPVSRVVSIVEKSIIMSRRPHAWTVRPCQWHIARGGPTIEKKFRKES